MTHKNAAKLNPIYADKPWLTKYLYSAADPNTKEGAEWHKRFARNVFIAVGAVVVFAILVFKIW
jgi:hypothetical protein